MKDRIEFDRVADSVRCGREVDDGALMDAWNYAADGVNEIYRLGKSLMEGFREQGRVIRRMEELLAEKDRQLGEKNRIIWVLNRMLRDGTVRAEDRGTTSSGPSDHLPLKGKAFDEGRETRDEDAGAMAAALASRRSGHYGTAEDAMCPSFAEPEDESAEGTDA